MCIAAARLGTHDVPEICVASYAGNADGLGNVRKMELLHACEALQVSKLCRSCMQVMHAHGTIMHIVK